MSIRKLTADFIFDGHQLLKKAILILDDKGVVIDCIANADENALNEAEYYEGVISPGFVNAHCHLELSHLHKKTPQHTGLVDFLLYIIQQRAETIENIQHAASAADQYMYEQGIVAVGDISNTDHTVSIKKDSNIYYHTFLETLGFNPILAEQKLQEALQIQQTFQHNNLSVSIVPHAPYSVSKELFQLIDKLPQTILSIHNQETEEENIFFKEKQGNFLRLYEALKLSIDYFKPSGKTSLQTYYPWITTSENIILVHNVAISQKEIQMLNNNHQHNFFFCICANANQYIEQKMPPLEYIENISDKVIIGTDSLASNHQLSILEELKTIQKHYPSISLEKLLQWSTYNGAKALQIDDRFGSFSKGKKPGVIQIVSTNNNIRKASIKRII